MSIVRVKICGLTKPKDASAACIAGADAIGLVFYPPSSRYVDIQSAQVIAEVIPPFVQRVGLFVNASVEEVNSVLEHVSLDLLQFHGQESASYCASFNKPYIKAIAMKPNLNLNAVIAEHTQARGFLLDTYHPAKPGGTGESFNWDLFPKDVTKPLILAGGLHAENVQQAISTCKPYAVDVSGGVESQPGIKSIEKIKAFIKQAKSIEITGK